MAGPEDELLHKLGQLPGASGGALKGTVVEVEENNIPEFLAGLHKLSEYVVYVGIPADAKAREEPHIANATLGYIHEKGSPINNVPARPFLYPGVKNSQNKWLPRFEAAGRAALDGNVAGMVKYLEEAGTLAQSAVQRRIQGGIPPPLSPATVRNRRRRSAGSKYRRKATTAAQTTPLYDTGQMLRSITYVVKKEG